MTGTQTHVFGAASDRTTTVTVSPSGAGAVVAREKTRMRRVPDYAPDGRPREGRIVRWRTRSETALALAPDVAEAYPEAVRAHRSQARLVLLRNALLVVLPFALVVVELVLRPVSGTGLLPLPWALLLLAGTGALVAATGLQRLPAPPAPEGVVIHELDRLDDDEEGSLLPWPSEARELALTLSPEESEALREASLLDPPAVRQLVSLLISDRQREAALEEAEREGERRRRQDTAERSAAAIHERLRRKP